jgi:hypothetical protein
VLCFKAGHSLSPYSFPCRYITISYKLKLWFAFSNAGTRINSSMELVAFKFQMTTCKKSRV